MMKLFRKIRQYLLSDPPERTVSVQVGGKTGTYLKYAFGEIVLVVFGILIALQINNWNEERKSNNQIFILLENLVQSIEEDKSYLKNSSILHEFRSNSLSHLLKITRDYKEPFSLVKSIDKLENNTFWNGKYPDTMNLEFAKRAIIYSGVHDDVVINKNVLDELKSTGLFSVLKSDSLKESINAYYSYVNRNFLIDDWNKDLCISWRHFLRNEYSVLTMELYNVDNPYDFVRSNEPVQIRIHEMIGPARFRSDNASKAILLADNLLREIDKYLNNK